MNPNKALWEKGDFTQIAKSMRESGEALVKSFGICKDQSLGSRMRRRNDGSASGKTGSGRAWR